MKLLLHEQAGALYLRIDESTIVESDEIQPGIVLDFDERGEVVGIEILGLQDRMPPVDIKRPQVEFA